MEGFAHTERGEIKKFSLAEKNNGNLSPFLEGLPFTEQWVVARDIDNAFEKARFIFKKYNLNCFAIDKDDYVITTHDHIWLSPTHQEFYKNAICVMPEDSRWHFPKEQLVDFNGICSDNIYHYKNYVTNFRHRRSSQSLLRK